MNADIVQFRRAERGDEPRLLAMQSASIRALGRAYYDTGTINAFIQQVGTMDRALIDDGTFFLAQVHGEIVACGGWSARRPDPAARLAHAGANAPGEPVVRSLYVHPLFAGRGFGRMVTEAVEIDIAANGHARVRLLATLMGVPLYRRLGYQATGAVTIGLARDRHMVGVTMEKSLDEAARMAA